MMRKLLMFGIVWVGVIVVSQPIALADKEGARAFVRSVSDRTIKLLKDTSIPTEEKEKMLNELFLKHIDSKWIARFVAGRYWRQATQKQQNEYVDAYRKFLLSTYVPRFRSFTDQEFKLIDITDQGDNEYLVETEIISNGEPPVRVNYKVRETNEDYLIFDIIAEGVSLITTQRSEFGSILSRKDMDYLIKLMRKKVGQS